MPAAAHQTRSSFRQSKLDDGRVVRDVQSDKDKRVQTKKQRAQSPEWNAGPTSRGKAIAVHAHTKRNLAFSLENRPKLPEPSRPAGFA